MNISTTNISHLLYIDVETRSIEDLESVGLHNYALKAEVLIFGWAVDSGVVRAWLPLYEPIPLELKQLLEDPSTTIVAWNASFERNILKYALKIDLPIRRFRDAMVLARSMSMPGKLESVCDILKIDEDMAKIKDGKRLIQLFSVQNGTRGKKTLFGVSDGFNDPKMYPDEFDAFIQYCIRDVEIERVLWNMLLPFSFPKEQWEDWFLDQELNEFGIPFNVPRAKKALALAEKYKAESKEKLNILTGLANANSRDQLLQWLKERGYPWGSLLKTYVDGELKNKDSKLTAEARDVLELRQKSSQNSYKKLETLLAQVSSDGRLRHAFQFMGASRTGRWSSAGTQIQNPPRPTKAFKDFIKKRGESEIFRLIDNEDYDGIKSAFDDSTLPFIASSIRMMIEAPAEHDMVVCDLSAIEFVTLGWLARCKGIMDCVKAKHDPYLDFAIRLYAKKGFDYDSLEKAYKSGDTVVTELRQNSKPPVLGCGYGLGGGELITNEFGDQVRSGLWGYAKANCGVELSIEEAHRAVKVYRETYPEVVQFWTDMEQAFKQTLKYGKPITVGYVTWDKRNKEWRLIENNFTGAMITFYRFEIPKVGYIIRMKLPSGRFLHYLNCRLEEEEFTYTDKKTNEKKTAVGEVIYYDGVEHSAIEDEDGVVSKKAHKWGKTKNYGGKEAEQATQGVARDILVNGCHLAKEMGFSIFGLFHDEMGTLVKKDWNAPTLEDLRFCMSQPPAWASTMILGAEGYNGKFYKKG